MRPFNKKKKKKALSFINRWLQSLELASLSAVWLTLWAGAVFLSYPGCVAADDRDEINEELLTDTGSEMRPASATLPWCDAISVIVGIVDILVLLAVVVCFVVTSRRLKRMQDAMKQRGERIHVEHIVDAVNISQTVTSLGHQFHHSDSSNEAASEDTTLTKSSKYAVQREVIRGREERQQASIW